MMNGKDKAYWLSDKIPAYGDYAVEAAILLKSQADEIDSLQAKIDALMMEYCPDEMTLVQVANWGKHQVAGPDFSDGHDCEGFIGGCERFGCPGGNDCTELAKHITPKQECDSL